MQTNVGPQKKHKEQEVVVPNPSHQNGHNEAPFWLGTPVKEVYSDLP